MKRSLGLAIGAGAGFLVLLGLGSRRGGAPQPLATGGPSRGSRILLVGDSFAVGLKAPLAALAAGVNVPFEGHGAVGTFISQWAGNQTVDVPGVGPTTLDLDGYLRSFRPTHVFVSLGTNDAKAGGTSSGSVQKILSKIQAARAVPLWIGPPTLPYSDSNVRSTVKATGVRYFPSEILSIPRGSDGLHPVGSGYSQWARAVWDWAWSGHTYATV